jgi:hypothetical protein
MYLTRALLIALSLIVTGCMAFPKYPTERIATYSYGGKAPSAKTVKISNVELSETQLAFSVRNDGKSTLKILWDETVLVMPDGAAKKVLPVGTKYADATRSIPPAVIPAGTSLETAVSRVDGISFEHGYWQNESLIPCGSNMDHALNPCDPKQYDGKQLSLLLTIEQGDKKSELRIDGALGIKPEYATWREKWEAEKKPKSQTPASSNTPAPSGA